MMGGEGDLDRITMEVLRNSFSSLVDEMGLTLSRSALSLVITFGKDFSGAVLTRDGDLVKQGIEDGLPAHVGTIPFTTRLVLDSFKGEIKDGDIYMTNDPYVGTHLPDIRMIKPIFWEGEHVANLCLCCHWTDVGGSVPGSFVCDARDSMTEGFTITPMRIVEHDRIKEDVQRLILRNVRLPDITRGDIRATVESLRTGERRFHSILRKYGSATILKMFRAHIDETERNFRSLIKTLPAGEYHWVDYIDKDPGIKGPSEPIKVELKLTIRGDGSVVYDFSGSDDQGKGAVNGGYASTVSGVIVATKSLFPEVDMCQGINNAIEVIARPGSVVNALWPAAVCGVGSCSFQKVYDCVQGAFSKATPGRVMSCGANETNFILAGSKGKRQGDFIMYCWTEGGYGAREASDNYTFISMYASGSKNQCVEAFEQEYPILWERFELVPDSGGAGKTRGGLGTIRRIRFSGDEASLSSIGDRERFPAWGLYGGLSALNQGLIINPGSANEKDIGVYVSGFDVRNGDRWDFWSGGGGGFGEPTLRPPESVLQDLIDGYITLEGARRDYGVVATVLDETLLKYEVDIPATTKLREGAKPPATGPGSPRKTLNASGFRVKWSSEM